MPITTKTIVSAAASHDKDIGKILVNINAQANHGMQRTGLIVLPVNESLIAR